MLTVHEGRLMVEEKAIYSIEKFLVARRLMYWQVYLHKTVLAAEQMLVKIMERARVVEATTAGTLNSFLHPASLQHDLGTVLQRFAGLDDIDVLMAVKLWQNHPDPILSTLCSRLLGRQLLKIRLQTTPIDEALIAEKTVALQAATGWSEADCRYMVFTGDARNTAYKTNDEQIEILFKNGSVKDISEVDHALIRQNIASTVGKHYICWPTGENL
jgi:hypothetical protein